MASWFETREDALLTMRVLRPHPEEARQRRLVGIFETCFMRVRCRLLLRCFDWVLDGCVFFEFDIVKLAVYAFDPTDVDILYDVPCVWVD